uniref:Uncharacterized protein n=1 Tax=Rhipicephalus zambeziensis TaxID=60191 RepID=A0A224YFW7_9ACAR
MERHLDRSLQRGQLPRNLIYGFRQYIHRQSASKMLTIFVDDRMPIFLVFGGLFLSHADTLPSKKERNSLIRQTIITPSSVVDTQANSDICHGRHLAYELISAFISLIF